MKRLFLFSATLIITSANAQGSSTTPEYFAQYEWMAKSVGALKEMNLEVAPEKRCRELSSIFSGDKFTDLQKKREWGKYENKLISLIGVVQGVEEIPLSEDYIATFKCINSTSDVYDFTVRIPSHEENFAYSLNMGDTVNTAVRIKGYSENRTHGIDTVMDYIGKTEVNGHCAPTLKKMDWSNGPIMYVCMKSKFLVQRLNFEISEKKSVPIYSAHLEDAESIIVFMSFPFDNNEELYVITKKVDDERSQKINFKSVGNCVHERQGNEISYANLKKSHIQMLENLKSLELSGGDALEKFLEMKALIESSDEYYSCETQQSLKFEIFNSLILRKL
jgi:hypothetical protein